VAPTTAGGRLRPVTSAVSLFCSLQVLLYLFRDKTAARARGRHTSSLLQWRMAISCPRHSTDLVSPGSTDASSTSRVSCRGVPALGYSDRSTARAGQCNPPQQTGRGLHDESSPRLRGSARFCKRRSKGCAKAYVLRLPAGKQRVAVDTLCRSVVHAASELADT
jgi:hypothetical protein